MMQVILKRIAISALLLIMCPFYLMAQQATVKRNVNLRSDPSSTNPALELLKAGAILTMLDSTSQGGYYHVKAGDGQEGWVWSKNVTVSPGSQSSPATSPTSSASQSAPATSATSSATSSAAAGCDDSLWDHVYHPQRLIINQKCLSVTGTIVDATNGRKSDGVRHEADGDTHGWLNLDPEFSNLLNAGNTSNEGGNLVFEIVCKFPVTQADAVASCPSGYTTPVQIPPVGSHVRIVGSYVQDTNHAKWMEIHPVTSITVIP